MEGGDSCINSRYQAKIRLVIAKPNKTTIRIEESGRYNTIWEISPTRLRMFDLDLAHYEYIKVSKKVL